MGKMKEKFYTEEQSVEQEIGPGDTIFVYDSAFAGSPRLGIVLYSKFVGEDLIHDVRFEDGTILQIFDVQARKAKKRLKRKIWLMFDTEGKIAMTSSTPPPSDETNWVKFVEEF